MDMKQSIHLNSILNARELGGYTTADGKTVKSGVLLRTANLYAVSDEDLRLLTDEYRLEHLIDFRMPFEIKGAKDPEIVDAEYHHLNVFDLSAFPVPEDDAADIEPPDLVQSVELSDQIGAFDGRMYIGLLAAQAGKDAYAEFFRILLTADPDRAVLWHCTSGKDRTGIAAMLLLSAFGADEELIVNDYLLTNAFNARRIDGTTQELKAQGYDDAFIHKANLVLSSVDENVMRATIDYLKKEYGSVVGYIRDELNITDKEINSLKEKYLF